MTRQLIVVDTETTGLTPGVHWPLEVAAANVTTGEEMRFVPMFPKGALDNASGEALRINRYFERGLHAERLNWRGSEVHWGDLWMMLQGNTLAGSNPAFDAAMITAGFAATITETHGDGDNAWGRSTAPNWHHRLADLSAYAGPALLLAPNELVGLAQVCEKLGVKHEDEHTALGDARATAECFRRLTHYYTHPGDYLPGRVAVTA